MKYTFHIVDVFSATPFGGNQLAVLPDAAGISTEGMQKIAREFNFSETTFVLPKKDPANTCQVRIFTPREELDFAGHPTVGTACALVMKQRVQLDDPARLIFEENIGLVTVDVASRNGGFHGKLTLSGTVETPPGAPSPTDLAAVLSIEPAEVKQVFFASVGLPICFAELSSNEVVDRAAVNRSAWAAALSHTCSPTSSFSQEIREMAARSTLACAHPRWASKKILRREALAPPSSGPWHQGPILSGRSIGCRYNKASQWGAQAKSKRRR